MWCYERKKEKEKEESRNQNSPKAFGELKNNNKKIREIDFTENF